MLKNWARKKAESIATKEAANLTLADALYVWAFVIGIVALWSVEGFWIDDESFCSFPGQFRPPADRR